jgi:hypothetical protein
MRSRRHSVLPAHGRVRIDEALINGTAGKKFHARNRVLALRDDR